jgi:hypothetical protein
VSRFCDSLALKAYRWSGWPQYMQSPGKRPPWLRVDRVMGEWGVRDDSSCGRRQLEQAMEQCKELELSKAAGDWKKLRRGWCWGPKGFREELPEMIAEKRGRQHHGEELKESDEQKAERMVLGKMRKLGWTQNELKLRRKGDKKKVWLAAQLRRETTMSCWWIAKRLEMGHWRTASNAVRACSAK